MTDTVTRLTLENETLRTALRTTQAERRAFEGRLRAVLKGYPDSDLVGLAAWYVARAELADLIGPDDAAAILGVSRRRVLVFIAEGRLEATNVGGEGRGSRYVMRRGDVERFAKARKKD